MNVEPKGRRGRRLAAISVGAGLLCLWAAPAALATGSVYWGNQAGNKISFANLDGTGGGDLATGAATINDPIGVAIDAVAGRIYWANYLANKISFANLDGSGGDDLATGSATVSGPSGVAIDPAAGRIYWANQTGSKISFAKLDGTGGGDLATGSATVNKPIGVAVDRGAGRIYWASWAANTISFANLDGTGGGDLNTAGATTAGPEGVAIDPAAGRIYWGNQSTNKISFAKLDGTGGGDLNTTGATTNFPVFPALLESPAGTGAPVVGGGASVGSTLSCSQGSWAPDLLSAFLFRAPQGLAFQWTLAGADIVGATGSSLTASAPGEYRCRVTALNHAGSAAEESAVFTVSPLPLSHPPQTPSPPKAHPPNTKITKAKVNAVRRTATFKFKATGSSTGFQCAHVQKRNRPKFKKCSSPKTYKRLKRGRYIFEVRALGIGGADPSPAEKAFRIG